MKKLWVIGDSTLSSFDDKYYYPRYGYGTQLAEYIEEYEVVNLALSGRSSKSYTTEPEYKELVAGMSENDYLLIGFGHNDEKTEAQRYTSPVGDYTVAGSIGQSLYDNYIKIAQKSGCRVILCTPIVRRTEDGSWKNSELHITKGTEQYPGGDYVSAIKELGAKLNIPVVDMTQLTKNLYDKLGTEETAYLHAWSSDKDVSVDNTHTNIWGARVNAFMCLREIKRLGIEDISSCITIDEADMLPAKELYLVSNEAYKPVCFNSELSDSVYWKECDGFKGTVFGDVSENFDKDKFTLEHDAEGNMHIAVRGNAGKIAKATDGIAMYYKKLPASKNFVFTAKARINDYFLNDQVSFGLMARDDMYIDMPSGDVLGDYVAAAPLMLTHRDKAVSCFARRSGRLVTGKTVKREYRPGDVIDLRIESTQDGYCCVFGEDEAVTGGFDFKLVTIDENNVYVGMFVARNADITFFDIKLDIRD